jgi:hypothetical protein
MVSFPTALIVIHSREVYSLPLRLHQQDVLQGSFAARNFLVQPGPLNLPPSERSLDTPSFRMVDFGRGQHFSDYGAKRSRNWPKVSMETADKFRRMKYDEQQAAQHELRLTSRYGCFDYNKCCPDPLNRPDDYTVEK